MHKTVLMMAFVACVWIGQVSRAQSDGAAPAGEVQAEYTQGNAFDADWRKQIVPGITTAAQALEALGPNPAYELVNGVQWMVFTHEVTTVREGPKGDAGHDVFVEEASGHCLRLLMGGADNSVVVNWEYESWTPSNRVSETAEHHMKSKVKAEDTATRETVIKEALAGLDAAGIDDEGVRRSMVNNALEAEGMEPLAEGEAVK